MAFHAHLHTMCTPESGEGTLWRFRFFAPSAKSSYGLDAKSCSKCGATFGRDKKYRVCVSVKGKRVTRVVDNLTIARETEAAIKGDLVRGEYEINRKEKKVPTLRRSMGQISPLG